MNPHGLPHTVLSRARLPFRHPRTEQKYQKLGHLRLELRTYRLRGECSTIELMAQKWFWVYVGKYLKTKE